MRRRRRGFLETPFGRSACVAFSVRATKKERTSYTGLDGKSIHWRTNFPRMEGTNCRDIPLLPRSLPSVAGVVRGLAVATLRKAALAMRWPLARAGWSEALTDFAVCLLGAMRWPSYSSNISVWKKCCCTQICSPGQQFKHLSGSNVWKCRNPRMVPEIQGNSGAKAPLINKNAPKTYICGPKLLEGVKWFVFPQTPR